MKVLVATEKPFSKIAVDQIREIVEKGGHTLALLEKYTDVAQFYEAVADADALIVRSDKVTREVIAAAKNLKMSLELARTKVKSGVVFKDKSSERLPIAELPTRSTNPSDSFKYLLMTKERRKIASTHSSATIDNLDPQFK